MSFSDTLWLKIWSTTAVIGFLIVIIGVVIEGVEHFKKFSKKDRVRKLKIEKFGWFLVVIGLAMEFLGDHAAKRISNRETARLNRDAGEARKEAGNAIKQAGEANKQAALANDRASTNELRAAALTNQTAQLVASNLSFAKQVEELRSKNLMLDIQLTGLKQQMALTSSNVENIIPENRPIKSMRVDVYLVILATNKFEDDLKNLGPAFKEIMPVVIKSLAVALILPKDFVYGKDSALGELRCKEYESRHHLFGGGTQYSMSFSWPSGDMSDMAAPIATNNVSVNDLCEKIGSLNIMIAGIEKHSDIMEGSCILTINGSIQERFSIPKFTDQICVNCPLMNSNGL
jgi:uncharacterized membrane protein